MIGGDHASIVDDNRRREQRAGEHFQKLIGIYPGLSDEGKRFCQALNRGGNQEIPRQFGYVR